MQRYVCIHGHFYQPPRENPWLESVELQDSADPYHDWNERITAECYAPNTAARILGEKDRIVKIVNNYSRISFNFGPTLLSWLEIADPEIYGRIIDADQESQRLFAGHGSALAQAYNHMILPLANDRDRQTQVLWGIRDFEHRFERAPDGMWLPETAVDLATLDALAAQGIRFAILAPHQAARVRKINTESWEDVGGGRIDPTHPYRCILPSGRAIALFFYDGPISRAIAFEKLLASGEALVSRLREGYNDQRTWPQLMHVATDGETFGHHHKYGDMALAWVLDRVCADGSTRLINYAQYLDLYPPAWEVEIIENTSWSCSHGIDRWRADCGCNTGSHAGWNQAWRAPLRDALDTLRDRLIPIFEQQGGELLNDPWRARDGYIAVILDRSPECLRSYLDQHSSRQLTPAEVPTVRRLMEMQRHALLMYTSCGWFFDDISGIETVQLLRYAGRAMQLAQPFTTLDLEAEFMENLAAAKSNLPAFKNGRELYIRFVKAAVVDLKRVAANYAVSSLFDDTAARTRLHCFDVRRQNRQSLVIGRAKLSTGHIELESNITGEAESFDFAALHLGNHNVTCNIRPGSDEDRFNAELQPVLDSFQQADFVNTVRAMDDTFGEGAYTIRSLFRDEQRRILKLLTGTTLAEAEVVHRQLCDDHTPLMAFLAELGIPIPYACRSAAEVVLNADIRKAIQVTPPDAERIQALLKRAADWSLKLNLDGIRYTLHNTVEAAAGKLAAEPGDAAQIEKLAALAKLASSGPFEANLWKAQNVCYDLLHTVYPQRKSRAGTRGATDPWLSAFVRLARFLSIQIDE